MTGRVGLLGSLVWLIRVYAAAAVARWHRIGGDR
jgi:hypothetical protein